MSMHHIKRQRLSAHACCADNAEEMAGRGVRDSLLGIPTSPSQRPHRTQFPLRATALDVKGENSRKPRGSTWQSAAGAAQLAQRHGEIAASRRRQARSVARTTSRRHNGNAPAMPARSERLEYRPSVRLTKPCPLQQLREKNRLMPAR